MSAPSGAHRPWPHSVIGLAEGDVSRTEHHVLALILGALIVVHGLIIAAIWALPAGEDAPFDPAHSWLLGDVRGVSVVLGILVALAFVATGVGVFGHLAWWPSSAIVAGFAGAVLMILWFDPWLSLGLGISVAVLVAGVSALANS
jgi:hypothetical protein